MTRHRLAPPNKWADLAFGISGAFAAAYGGVDGVMVGWTWRDGVCLAAGPLMLSSAVSGWRWRRTHRGLLEATDAFKTLVRALRPTPAFYRHDETQTLFMRIPGRVGENYLFRVPEAELDQVDRSLDDDGTAGFVVEEFIVGPLSATVHHSAQGARLRQGPDGLEVVDDSDGNESRWRRLRGAWLSLASGLLDVTEAELREVHAQLSEARAINPEDEEP